MSSIPIVVEPWKANKINDARHQLFVWARDENRCFSTLWETKAPNDIVSAIGGALTQAELQFDCERSLTPQQSMGLTVNFPTGDRARKIEAHVSAIYSILSRIEQVQRYEATDQAAIQGYLWEICALEAEASLHPQTAVP